MNNTKIIIIGGKARSGKDTVSKYIKEIYNNKKVLNIQYSSYIKEYAKKISNWDGLEETKPRELLQEIGSIVKEKIDNNFFVNKIIDDIKVYSLFFDVITISDVRYKIEIDIPKKYFNNVTSIHVVRPNYDNGLNITEKNHPTEIDLDDYNNFDYEIINDGSIEKLKNEVEKIIKEIDINE